MNDTDPKAEKKFREMMMARTGEERLIMGCDMADTSREIVGSAIRRDHPGATDAIFRRNIFLRFYGHEYSPGQRDEIIFWLLGSS